MSTVAVLNTDAGLTGKTIDLLESAQTITGLKTFDLDPAAPFAVTSGSAKVANLDADKLDGIEGSAFLQKDISAITDGQLLIGKTSDHSLNLAAITAGSNITVTNGAGAITIAAASPIMTLLKANSGTDTSAGATTVDSIATGVLTAKDRLLIEIDVTSITQQTAGLQMYSVTDATSLGTITSGAISAGETVVFFPITLRVGQAANTSYHLFTAGRGTTLGAMGTLIVTGSLTAWTTGFTLGLRHTGVTAGGTMQWSWAVYKLAGQ